MAGVANSVIELKKLLEVIGDIAGRDKGIKSDMFSLRLNEFNPGIIAKYVNMAVGVSGEAAGERGEVGESGGESSFEKGEEIRNRVRRRRKKNTLLNIVTGEHRKIGNRELEGGEGGRLIGKNRASRENRNGRGRHGWVRFGSVRLGSVVEIKVGTEREREGEGRIYRSWIHAL